ncbi:MAG TPA: hypothetical protein DEO73_08605 [Pantoea sp.]|nr:hypothetical protein [Pantoea sp.]
MNVIFQEMNHESYFSDLVFIKNGYGTITSRKAIFIGDFPASGKEGSGKNYRNNLSEIRNGQNVDIYFHQKDNDNFHDNCSMLINTLKYFEDKIGEGKIKIIIITDHYNYYYREIFSRIYLDTSLHNKFKASESKILLKILIKTYFGFRFSSFMKACYHRVRRLIRY